MERHFTVTGFVCEGDRTLLHWHKKLRIWLPPGGHIDPDEDPVQAAVREVLEETGILAEVVPHVAPLPFSNVAQIATPLVIICADVDEGPHQHIDMSYALRPVPGAPRQEPDGDHGFIWVTEEQLRRDEPLPVASCGVDINVEEDVRVLGLRAIELVRASARNPEPRT
jgi:8-oxo-dGTP pyrophosphatase MutT (NUDIX family)